MYKLIDSASFFNEKEPQVTIVNTDNLNELVKQAADERITSYTKTIKPQPGKMYIHINAMGAGEYYGSNKNGDFFPEEQLKFYHQTFETSPAHVFRHHINKDPAKAIGRVLFSIYNERMHRVELVAEVDKQLGRDIEERLAQGDYPSTSMACKTPYDVCSICHNKAHTRQEYCQHLRNHLGELWTDGRRVMALNVGPLKFFDISVVIKPADVTSGVLQKVASEVEEIVGSAEMAELEDISEVSKEASFRKFADIIKEVTGIVDKVSPELEKIVANTNDLPHSVIGQLRLFQLSDTLNVLADLGISPSIEFLAELIARKTLGDEGRGMGKLVSEYLKHVDPETTDLPIIRFEKPERTNILALKLLSPHVEKCSLLPEFVEKRASLGYASFNPHGYEEQKPLINRDEAKKEIEGLAPLAKTLLSIGGVALIAKMYITHLIEEKLKTRNFNDYGAKIVIVKQSSDYLLAFKLAKYATARELNDRDNKDLDRLATATRNALKLSKADSAGKLSKVIKSIQLGSKAVDKYNKGT
jgi:hypothetical protein